MPTERPNPYAHPPQQSPEAEKDPDILVDLVSAANAFEADVIAQALKSHGIPAHAFSTAANILQWEVIMTDPYRVQVRRGDLSRARALLGALKPEAASIDWDEVDIGEPLEPEAAASRDKAGRGQSMVLIAVIFILFAILIVLMAVRGAASPP
ncbi:MAG: hypothetical protein KIT24_12595 [Phycisphaeraceae bacterium]|nr:hypothetical protein [Phycisphaeraceae bacterium]